MKLPNRKNAIIPRRKLINYVLSETQPKAEFFRIIDFTRTNFRYLKKVIYQLAQSEKAKEVTDINPKPKINLESHKSDEIINRSKIDGLPFIYPSFIHPYT